MNVTSRNEKTQAEKCVIRKTTVVPEKESPQFTMSKMDAELMKYNDEKILLLSESYGL